MKIADCSRLIVVTVGCAEGLEFKYGGEVKGDECMVVEREREREGESGDARAIDIDNCGYFLIGREFV